jgi:kynurenine formamidase
MPGGRERCMMANESTPRLESHQTNNAGAATSSILSNWGRFGPDDELGTLNFLTPQRVLAGAACIRHGKRYTLNLPMDLPTHRSYGRPGFSHVAYRHNEDLLGMVCNDDYVVMALQGSSQWDSLVHAGLREPGVEGIFYNGAGTDAVDEDGHAVRNGIEPAATSGIAGRGVLLDIARMVADGAPGPLPDDFLITEEVTLACARTEGVEIEVGDIVCFRTGWTEAYLDADTDARSAMTSREGEWHNPGISPSLVSLAYSQGWSAVTADNMAVEAVPILPDWTNSAHILMQRNLGLLFGELFIYRELAEAAVSDHRWDFFFVSVPLRTPGGMGSPSCAMAIR